MPIVHACGRAGCNVLTMGEFCVEHEALVALPPARRPLPRLLPVLALVAASAVAAIFRAHFPR